MAAPSRLTLRFIRIEQGGEALRLAAAAWPEIERSGQLAMIANRSSAGNADELLLVESRQEETLVAAALAQRLPGKTAVVWPPQSASPGDHLARVELLQAICARLAQAGTHLAQTLLDSPTSPAAAELAAAGFVHAGDLLYMAAPRSCFPGDPPRSPLVFESYSPPLHDRLLGIVEATYQGSLDCPMIDGLRQTADVLEGYRAVGRFRPEWWLIVSDQGRDVGCLLLADHPAENQSEIVYVGVVPSARGRGLGLALTRHSQWLANRAGKSRLVLGVDAANAPAVAVYAAAGCIAWDRRSVFVRALCRGANGNCATG